MLGVLCAWLFADFIAGVFHWIEDRYLREDWPLVGKYIAAPNARHHLHPQEFLVGGYWERNWTTIVPAMFGFVVSTAYAAPWWISLGFLFLTQANEIHAWGHRKGRIPMWVELLQETGIVQSSRHHSLHHRSPHQVRYCVMSNWLNPWLDALRFWFFLELVIGLFGGRVKS